MFLFARGNWLPLKRVLPLYRKSRFESTYGVCDPTKGIFIRIRWDNGRPLHAYAIVDTMAHELAHLRFLAHSPNWFRLHSRILLCMSQSNLFQRLKRRMNTK